jgi:hypothetical protein
VRTTIARTKERPPPPHPSRRHGDVKPRANPHPNATIAGGGAGAGALVIWAASRFGVTLTAYEGILVASGLSTVALLIGRNGLAGLWKTLLHGKSTT